MINSKTKIEEIVKIDSKMMEIFNRNKIDYCCNGHLTIEEVAKEKKMNPDDLIKLVEENIKYGGENQVDEYDNIEEFKSLDIDQMVDSIIKNHHEKERSLLFEIDPNLNKIMLVHYEHHGEELLKLHSLFEDLKKELEEHFVKEEKMTFPLMLENKNPNQEIIEKVHELETDHEKAGDLIKEMIDLTNWFEIPADGCNTYKFTFNKLETLVKDIFVHIFKENSILFKKFTESEEIDEKENSK